MKYVYFFILLLASLKVVSQEKQKANQNLRIAKALLNSASPGYNPQKAYDLCFAEASSGDSEAMNALGILYSKGMGTAVNTEEAVRWFKKSAEAGYKNAWYNLADMYRTGRGVDQDFNEAYRIFSKGATLGSINCMYAIGYLHYKGLGCQQSYGQAVSLFRYTANKGYVRSMFMLGLCHRNGYGIAKNIDSARYWIKRSADKGYKPAKNELEEKEAENNSYKEVQEAGTKTKQIGTKTIAGTVTPSTHNFTTGGSLTGNYKGYVLKYDWSGQYIVSKKKLEVQLQHDQHTGKISGKWIEDDTISADISALLTDTALVFDDTFYSKVDHYSAKRAVQFDFKSAHLQLTQQKDTVLIAGKLQLWSWLHNEPEKPMYVSLNKVDNKENFNQNDRLIVYPNPFVNSLTFNLLLESGTNVSVVLADMTGRVVHTESVYMPAGQHSHTLEVRIPSGAYALKVSYQNKTRSALVIKQ